MLKFLAFIVEKIAKTHGVPAGKSPSTPPPQKTERPAPWAEPSLPDSVTVEIDRLAMIAQLRLHEGERLKPYRCTAGKLTIGVGRNLDDRGITAQESAMLLENDIDAVEWDLRAALPWVQELDEVRQRVLLDMCFNLGLTGLLGFKRTLAAIKGGQYARASAMMLQSRWATQVGERATRLSQMMMTGQIPDELR